MFFCKEDVSISNGMVKWFNEKKDLVLLNKMRVPIFVHHTGINAPGFKTLKEGDQVVFDIEQGSKGPRAANVTVV
jgi:CspA family cold shock protein